MLKEDSLTLFSIQEWSYSRAGPGILESYPKDHSMDADQIAQFLDKKRFLVLATTRPGGRPQAAPVAFSVWKGAFWFASVRSARIRNLRTKPYASIVIMEGEGKTHQALISEGRVQLHAAKDFLATQVEFAESWHARHGQPASWASVIIELRPERLFSFSRQG